jgi:predicted RNA polymerase sigma factor
MTAVLLRGGELGPVADHDIQRARVLAVPVPRLQRGLPGATGPDNDPVRHDLTAEAIRLTRLIRALLPEDGEVAGLLALMLLTETRRPARVSASGELVALDEQDRGRPGTRR